MGQARILLAAALVAALAALATGCTQKLDRATNPPGPVVDDFTTPAGTLSALVRAVHERNTISYGLCLADTATEGRDFHATCDPADSTAFEQAGGVSPGYWNKETELTFFAQFVTYLPNARYDVHFRLDTGPGNIVDVGGATAKKIYNEHYRVWSGASPVCAGAAHLTFERVGASGEYRITFWEDRRDTANVRTWGAARLVGR